MEDHHCNLTRALRSIGPSNVPSAPASSSPASPIPSSWINPDAITPQTKRKRSRPRKADTSTPSTKFLNSVAFPTPQNDPEATSAPVRTPPGFLSPSQLKTLSEQQRRESGANKTGPQRARVVHLPPESELADRAQKRPKKSSHPATTATPKSFEGHARSPTNGVQYGDATANRLESGLQRLQSNQPPSPPRPERVLENSALSIALGREITDENRGHEFHLIPVPSFGGDYTEELYIPDLHHSKEALMFCGLTDDVTAVWCEEWKSHGRPGALGNYALTKIRETATNKGFNPWACSEIGRNDFWNRMRNQAIPRQYHNDILEKAFSDGKKRWEWERNWTKSLRDMGFAQPLIDIVNQSQYEDMREYTQVSLWAYNWIRQKWTELMNLSTGNFIAEKKKKEEERKREWARKEQLFQQQQLARRLSGTAKIEGRRIAALIGPRPQSAAIEYFPSFFLDVRHEPLYPDLTEDVCLVETSSMFDFMYASEDAWQKESDARKWDRELAAEIEDVPDDWMDHILWDNNTADTLTQDDEPVQMLDDMADSDQ